MANYAILRTEKLKTPGNIGGASAHNTRLNMPHNADPERTHLNRYYGAKNATKGVQKRIDEMYEGKTKANGKPKVPHKNAVPAFEVLTTASPQFFDEIAPNWRQGELTPKFEEWVKDQLRFVTDRFGKDNITQGCLHMDEETPHMQFIVVPEVDGKLNARAILGGKARLGSLQTEYADRMAKFGLERGIEGSKARHVKPSKNYASQIQDKEQVIEALKDMSQSLEVVTKKGGRFSKAKTTTVPAFIPTKKNLAKFAENLQPVQSSFATRELERRSRERDAETNKKLRRDAADRVRDIPLSEVAKELGMEQDRRDKTKWSNAYVTVALDDDSRKFNDFGSGKGGRGSIDLTMHVMDCDFNTALGYLRDRFDDNQVVDAHARRARDYAQQQVEKVKPIRFQPPKPEPKNLNKVREYLIVKRCLDPEIVDHHINNGSIYADSRSNAVFLSQGRAELVGTGVTPFKGLAPGSRKDGPGFIAEPSPGYVPKEPVPDIIKRKASIGITESAIDALSYAQVKNSAAMSTAGTPDKGFFDNLRQWVWERFEYVKAAFDKDDEGRKFAEHMYDEWSGSPVNGAPINSGALYKDEPPKGKDWNEHVVNTSQFSGQNITERLNEWREAKEAPKQSKGHDLEK